MKNWQKVSITLAIIWSFLLSGVPARAQGGDIVSSDDISGGSSVFVFRNSRKAPQQKFVAQARRSSANRTDARRKVKEQVIAVNKTKPTRVIKKVDPNAVALNTKVVNNAAKLKASDDLTGGAEVFLERGDADRAIEYFKKAIVLNPKNQNAKLGMSEAFTVKGDKALDATGAESAIPFYEQAVALNSQNSGAFASLGGAYDQIEQNEKAIPAYEKALALNNGLTEIFAPLGVLYYLKGDIAQADNYLGKASATRPNDFETQYFTGLVRYKQNRNDEAVAALQKSVEINPQSAEAHYYLGETYDREDKSQLAVSEYKAATTINPRYTEAWFDLGVANYNRNSYDDSINAYKKVIELKNDYGEAHQNLAEVYRQIATDAKEPKKRNDYFGLANGEYSVASTFIKNDSDLYSKWGYCLGAVAKWNSAVDALNKAVAISPDAIDYTNIGWAYYNGAQLDLRDKKQADADTKLAKGRDALQKATTLNDKFEAAFLNLGVTLTDLGDFQGSVNALTRANELRKNWIPALNELGLAFRKMDQFENAVVQFHKVLDINDKFVPALYNLGETEYRRGNTKEAKRIQEKLRKLNPNLANQLNVIISGAVLTNPADRVKNKVQEKNPLNKIPKLPY